VKILDGQQWCIEFDGHKLRYAGVLKRSKNKELGHWRTVKNKGKERRTKWWEIPSGGSSGLPQTLFTPLRDAIFEDISKLTPEKRTFERVLSPTRRGLERAAKLIGFTVKQGKGSKRRFTLYQHGAPTMGFLVVDFKRHAHHEYFHRNGSNEILKNRRNKPKRDLRKLSKTLRKRRPEVVHMEEKSSTLLRWVIVVFGSEQVWLVPAKTRKAED
jgi:hypothetical protein